MCQATKGYWRKEKVEEEVLNLIDQWFGQFDFDRIQTKVAESFGENADQVADSLVNAKEQYEGLQARRTYYTEQLNAALTSKATRIPLSVIEEQLNSIEADLTKAKDQFTQLDKQRSTRMVETETLHQLAQMRVYKNNMN